MGPAAVIFPVIASLMGAASAGAGAAQSIKGLISPPKPPKPGVGGGSDKSTLLAPTELPPISNPSADINVGGPQRIPGALEAQRLDMMNPQAPQIAMGGGEGGGSPFDPNDPYFRFLQGGFGAQ